jgi:nucleosome assembly protein 1-like 1
MEVEACDAINDIKGTVAGVNSFWMRGMLNHKRIGPNIEEKDRSILAYLTDIRLTYHEKGQGFDLVFYFNENEYFSNKTLTKSFQMSKPNIIEKAEGTPIEWAEGRDVTSKKVKGKKKKGKTAATKTVVAKSFFNFFLTQEMPDFAKLIKAGKDGEAIDEEEMKE